MHKLIVKLALNSKSAFTKQITLHFVTRGLKACNNFTLHWNSTL